MSMTWKRFLSLLLALTMILSLGIVGYAEDGETEEEPVIEIEEDDEDLPEEVILETEPISPDKLNIRKLGVEETTEEDEELVPMDEEDLNKIVRVSIFLDKPSTLTAGFSAEGVGTNSAAIAYRDGLKSDQAQMTAQIEAVIGHPLNVHWNLTLAVNAISADLSLAEMVKVREIPGVKSVERENQYLPMDDDTADPNTANTSENMVGATAAWEAGYTGAGSRIAIIDTGIDTSHQSFAEEPFTYSVGLADATSELMTRNEVQALAGQLNSGTGNYVSAKIPYGYNYVDKNTTINHLNDTQGEHGSHVAGIAAANRYVGTAHDEAADTVGAVGMAPDAQLFIMKVFGAGGGAYDSDYMVAIEDAMVLGCDVCNLSLGSAVQGWTFDNDYQDMILNWADRQHNAKMVVSISAGNAYDLPYMLENRLLYGEDVSTHTGGSPGTFLNSLCVAAAQNTITKGTPMQFNGSQDVYYYESTESSDGTAYTNPELTTIVGSYSYVYIDAIGSAEDYSAVNSAEGLAGKVVIVNRGSISFVEKGENAKSYNPKALIVANNSDGTIYMDLTDFTGTFPMVTITLKDAKKIKTGGTEHTTSGGITYYTGSMKVTNTEKEVVIDRSQATITDFSSWGVPGSLVMKPEITAPGGDIYSVAGTNTTSGGGTAGGSDKYEYMSGTSMAAPHITGLTAVLAEYLRENPIADRNSALAAGYSTRAITQSLMMSTATAMTPENMYLPILQQGAGLADVSKAVTSNSVVMIDPSRSYLTGLTGAAADGKVKVELGDDPARKGDYQFGFTVYNLTDDDLTFKVETEIFTQAIEGDFLSHSTTVIPAGTSFLWEGDNPVTEGHDVNQDGVTNISDAQAILDYLTGVNDGENLDLEAGDLDGDEVLSSYDAYLLLGWEGDEGENGATGVVPAHGSRYCSVRITFSEDLKNWLDAEYACGAYIQGFTYITAAGTTKDGGVNKDEHSIPILGYYGSWTDATMFDTKSYTEKLYGSEQVNYSGNDTTNYLKLQMNGSSVLFSGNPYMVETSFPADRLAINSNTSMVAIAYNLVRAAGTTGFAVSKVDGEGQVTEVLSSVVTSTQPVTGMYYSSTSGWQGLTQRLYGINKTAADYGLAEGELFRVGFYAIPEYNAMVVNDDYTSADAGVLDNAGFKTLLESNVLGKGAFVGYDFVVDDTAPQIGLATLDSNTGTLTVAATDDQALAYVAVLSLDGSVVYAEEAPGVDEYEISLDASNAIANAKGYVAVFAGDYAGNEAAVAVKVNDDCYEEKTVYVLTDILTAGNDYVIANTNAIGTGYALGYTTGSWSNTVSRNAVTVNAGIAETSNKPYIDSMDVATTSVWSASGNTYLKNGNNYLRRSTNTSTTLSISTTNSYNTWQYSNNQLSFTDRATYLRYYNNSFSLSTTASTIYLYQKTVIRTEINPYAVTSVTVTPDSLDLYKGNTAEINAKVLPLTATDRTVTWSSSNTSVATVDEFGKVTAVAAGSATITATANGDTAKSASCAVTVTAINKALNGIVWDEEGRVYFSSFNANGLPTWTKLSGEVGTYLTNAFMFNSSTLYASTNDLNDSIIYSVNRTSYALTEFGVNFVPAFGMARGTTAYQSAGYDFFVYGFAKYLILGNVTPDHEDPDDDTSAMYSGLPYGLLDLSETDVGDAYVCAVCAKTVSSNSSGSAYYFLDETGKIWQTTQSYSNTNGFTFSTPSLVVDTGIGTSFMYQSLYYDGTYLYWSHQADNIAELIIIVPSTGKVYHAGDFGDGVWPAAGIYVNGSAAPASVGDEIMGEPVQLQRVAGYFDLVTEDVIARMIYEASLWGIEAHFPELPWADEDEEDEDFLGEDEEPIEEPVEEPEEPVEEPEEPVEEPEEPVEEPEPIEEPEPPVEGDEGSVYLGSLTAFRGAAPSVGTVDPEQIPDGEYNDEHEGEISIEIAEDEDSHNGMFALAYDPEALTFTGFEANEDISIISVFPDEDKAVITVAYANVADDDDYELPSVRGGLTDYILRGDTIITLYFTVKCEDSEIEAITLERNEEIELNENATLSIAGTGHAWGEPSWEWAEDNSTATATFVCQNDGEHTRTERAEITSNTTEPSCETAGKTVYTATVTLDGETYTDTREETIEATGHAWGEPSWEWAEDYSSAAATFVCDNDESHVRTLNAEISFEEVENGILYTATVTLDGEVYTDQQLDEFVKVTILFDAGAGTVAPDSVEITAGDAIGELPVPTREGGWVFLGWYLAPAADQMHICEGTAVTADTTFDEGATIYAHWRLPGDVNGDGRVNVNDVTLLAKYVKARGVGVDIVPFSGNVDGSSDGKVNAADQTLLAKYVKARGVGVTIY